MHYQPYLSLSIQHEYYQQQGCHDFILVPTHACQHQLQKYHCVVKTEPSGFHIYAPVGETNSSRFFSPSGLRLTFLLELQNPEMIGVTELEQDYQPGRSFYYFSNHISSPDDGKMSSDILPSQLYQFHHLYQKQRSPVEARCAKIPELHSIDRGKILGVVEIDCDTLKPSTIEPKAFKILFKAKKVDWRYYLVTDKFAARDTFSIQDQNTQSEIKFKPVKLDENDPINTRLKQNFPNSQTFLWMSVQPVPCCDTARAKLHLTKHSDNTVWIPNLPNPPDKHGIQVINLLADS